MGRVNIKRDASDNVTLKSNAAQEKAVQKILDSMEFEHKKDEELVQKGIAVDGLARRIRDRFSEAEVARKEVEQRWLKDLRQYRGQYDPEVLSRIHPNRSKAYIRVTRSKVKTVDSRLTDLLFPGNGEDNWSIRPTVIPQLDETQMRLVMEGLHNSGVQQVTREMLDNAVRRYAQERADKMATKISDQLSQMNYRETLRSVIHSGNLYGTGILKGPMIMLSKHKSYVQVETDSGKTSWKLESKDELLPYIEEVPVWDFYPDMTAYDIRDCRYVIQRHKMTKRQLLDLGKRSDFSSSAINTFLEGSSDGNWEDKYFDHALKEIGERSTSKFNPSKQAKKYEIIEYWGYLDASDLEAAGADVPEEMKGQLEIASNVWLLGDKIIKAAVSHMGDLQWPFFLYYYDKDETSLFGEGIPSILRDIQELINSAFRAMLDNAAISAGPQFEVNLDLLSEDEDPTDIHPFKVWLRTGEGVEAAQEAVRVKQVPSHTAEFLQMCQTFESYADEVTTIPRYMWGEATPGISRTSSGLSMLMGSANVTIKDQVKNFDTGITCRFITNMYHWNMKFGTEEDIKGDYDIRAEGMASLIAKEVYSQSLMQFLNITNNAAYQPMIKSSVLLRKIAEALELGDHDLVLSEEEITANKQAQQQEEQTQRDFMLKMTETARKYGTSPVEMVDSMRMAYADYKNSVGNTQVD